MYSSELYQYHAERGEDTVSTNKDLSSMVQYGMNVYRACKYKNKWAVYDTCTKVYYFVGTGMKNCIERAKELNKD